MPSEETIDVKINVDQEGLNKLKEVNELTKVKPGYKTSEFWLSAFAALLGFVVTSGVIQVDTQWDKIIGIATTLLAGLGYTYSRTQVKK